MIRLGWILLLFAIPICKAFSFENQPDSSYYILKNFDKDLHIFDAEKKQFIPLLTKGISATRAHTVFFDRSHFSRYELLILSQSTDGLLYINGKLFRELPTDKWLYLSVNDIPAADSGLVMLTLYGSKNIADKRILIGSKLDKTKVSKGISRDRLSSMKTRVPMPFQNTCLLVFCCIFVYTTLLSSSNPKAFGEYFSISDIFVTKIRDTKYLISKPLNRTNQSFVILLSLSSAFLYVVLAANGIYLFENRFNLNPDTRAFRFLLAYVVIAGLSYLLYFVKLVFLNIMAQLFGLEKSVNIHYFKSIQFTLLWSIALSLAFYIYYLHIDKPSEINHIYIFWLLLMGYLLRCGLIYLSILKSTGIQSLYLIAYLCVVEILPITIGIRLAF